MCVHRVAAGSSRVGGIGGGLPRRNKSVFATGVPGLRVHLPGPAGKNNQQMVEPEHVFKALLEQQGGLTRSILKEAGAGVLGREGAGGG